MKFLILTLFLVELCLPARILVFSPKFGFSHMNIVGKIADTIQESGHDVTVFQPIMRSDFPGTGCQKAHVVALEPSKELKQVMKETHNEETWGTMWSANNYIPVGSVFIVPILQKVFTTSLDNIFNNTALLEDLRSQKFDAIVHEMFDYSGFALQHELNIPISLGIHTCSIYETTASQLGLPQIPGDVPDLFGIAPLDGSFFSRLAKFFYSFVTTYFERGMLEGIQKWMDQKFENSPRIREMVANLSFIFVNSDPWIDFPRPTLHKIVDIGGIGVKKPSSLSEKWLKVLNRRERNVLISFGTVAPAIHMPEESKQGIVDVVKEFPNVTFIWKYEKPEDGIGRGVDNLVLSKWTPQADLLVNWWYQPHGSVVDQQLSQLDANNVKREFVGYGLAAFTVLLLCTRLAPLVANLICIAYPIAASLGVLRGQSSDANRFLIYWTIFGVLSVFDYYGGVSALYWIIKVAACLVLYLPQTQGAALVYSLAIEPIANAVAKAF